MTLSDTMEIKDLLDELTGVPAVSGCENNIATLLSKKLSDY